MSNLASFKFLLSRKMSLFSVTPPPPLDSLFFSTPAVPLLLFFCASQFFSFLPFSSDHSELASSFVTDFSIYPPSYTCLSWSCCEPLIPVYWEETGMAVTSVGGCGCMKSHSEPSLPHFPLASPLPPTLSLQVPTGLSVCLASILSPLSLLVPLG